ncbi:MAG: DUF721 domain-containing protein [Rhodospirillaceae bacterium]|nr:DUF721 domain-containing protein [Rhodospirillaceae bacterium]
MTVRRHQIRSISASVERLTRPIFQRRGFGGAGIIEHWPDIVGSHLAGACLPERISYPGQSRRGGTLHLRVDSSSLALEIQHLEPQIIERINSHFGYGAIARLRIQHGPITRAAPAAPAPAKPAIAKADAQALDARLGDLDAGDLTEALRALGQGVMARNAARKKG